MRNNIFSCHTWLLFILLYSSWSSCTVGLPPRSDAHVVNHDVELWSNFSPGLATSEESSDVPQHCCGRITSKFRPAGEEKVEREGPDRVFLAHSSPKTSRYSPIKPILYTVSHILHFKRETTAWIFTHVVFISAHVTGKCKHRKMRIRYHLSREGQVQCWCTYIVVRCQKVDSLF